MKAAPRRHLDAPHPAGRTPPFLVAESGAGLALIAPFAARPRGPTAGEVALVETVATHLARELPAPPCWVTCDGTVTPATIGAPQITRRLMDSAWFPITWRKASGQ